MPVDGAPFESLTDLPAIFQRTEGWSELVSALRAHKAGTIDGTWGSSAALAIASLGVAVPKTILVVLAHPGDLDHWSSDILSFTGIKASVLPAWESWPPEKTAIDSTPGQRLRLTQKMANDPPRIILTTMAAVMQPVPSHSQLASRTKVIRVGDSIDITHLARWLVDNGFKRSESVELPGEFSIRGGIVDLFSLDAENPIRLEFFGDDLESIRPFAAATQRSLGDWKEVAVLGATVLTDANAKTSSPGDRFDPFPDYLPADAWTILVEPNDLKEQARFFLERVGDPVGLYGIDATFAHLLKFPNVMVSAMPRPSSEESVHLRVESVERFSGNVQKVREELDAVAHRDSVMIACGNEAELQRMREIFQGGQIAEAGHLKLVVGSVRSGFRLVQEGIVVLGSHELFRRDPTPIGDKEPKGLPKRRIESRAIDSFLELNEGDIVVHVAHGIAIFRGMALLDKATGQLSNKTVSKEENLILEFRDAVLMYVPVSKIDLVQKYVGGNKAVPEPSKIGGASWGKKKEKVQEAVQDMAAEMIQIQAMRAAQVGFALPNDSDWQKSFEDAFPYQETPDQITAIAEIKKDLSQPRPMDRLLCGDVGYGKTEMAIRAAFKCVDNGKQVAILVPTTVLAEQHYRTFKSRFAEYPFTVEVLSRFRTAGEVRKVVKALGEGKVDIVVGTHRLVSADVKFKDLGLVIVDEEQRFGVDHKEKLKKIRSMVHVLTMTATPIPRTLHLALLGIRDISNLETPPPERIPVETRIIRFDDKLIRNAILRELNRDGQVFFVHNRVYDIEQTVRKLQAIVPEARIIFAHGQMAGHELEEAMVKFVRHEADILVATTIIESGVDIPNANTMFIDDAHLYGLADLHQLRGRVGRQKNRAYAYLLLSNDLLVTGDAAKRLKAIEEFTELGAGFKIAMRDLEIRGAGNILGTEQSGHIAAVGYELYCSLLENAVRSVKNLPLKSSLEVTVDLPWTAYLPRDYVPAQKLRMEVYRRLARIRDSQKLEDFKAELQDRYGPIPEPAEWMLRIAEIRLLCAKWRITSLHVDGPALMFTYGNADLARNLEKKTNRKLKIIDEKTLYWKLLPEEEEPEGWYELLKELLER